MRPSKYDKYICIVCLIVFLYSFFIVGGRPVYESEKNRKFNPWDKHVFLGDDGYDELVGIEYPSSVFVAPFFFMVFFFLIVFEKPLRPVDRHWVKQKIKAEWQKVKS